MKNLSYLPSVRTRVKRSMVVLALIALVALAVVFDPFGLEDEEDTKKVVSEKSGSSWCEKHAAERGMSLGECLEGSQK